MAKLNEKQRQFVSEYLVDLNATHAAIRAGIELLESPPTNQPYVYVLIRGDTQAIVYVGKGRGRRMYSHISEARSGRVSGAKKFRMLTSLLDRGVEVSPRCVFVCETDAKAFAIERNLIASLNDAGLANSSGGSRDPIECQLVKVEDLIARLRTKDDWLSRVSKRTDVAARFRTAAFYDKFRNTLLGMRTRLLESKIAKT